jgi:ribosome-associated protein
LDSLEMARLAAAALDDKKGGDIRILGVDDLTIIADYFVIATGSSVTQVRALADEAEYRLEQAGVKLRHREGMDKGGWIALDFGAVIVHVFQPAARDFYSLEKLWADARLMDSDGPPK